MPLIVCYFQSTSKLYYTHFKLFAITIKYAIFDSTVF